MHGKDRAVRSASTRSSPWDSIYVGVWAAQVAGDGRLCINADPGGRFTTMHPKQEPRGEFSALIHPASHRTCNIL